MNIGQCEQAIEKAGLVQNIMVDCSHENTSKDAAIHPLVMENVTNQILEGNKSIVGLMIESNIEFGRQDICENLADMKYGQSVTDACISWDMTEESIRSMHKKLKEVLPKR